MRLRDKYGPWAVITGGSEGVGAAFARKLAAAGVNLVLVARKPTPLAEIKHELRNQVQVRTLSVDLVRPDAVDQIATITNDIDVGLLICNAGATHNIAPFFETPLSAALNIAQLNVSLPIALCHRFGAAMKSRGRGGIMLVGSMAGYAGSPNVTAYAGAKAFLRIFAEGLWYELKPSGVDVLCLVLGATKTPAMDRSGMKIVPGYEPADPDLMAQEGLDHLDHGPVRVANNADAAALHLVSAPRGDVVAQMAEATRALFAKDPA